MYSCFLLLILFIIALQSLVELWDPKDLRVLRSRGMVVGDGNFRLLEKLVEQIQQKEIRGWQTLGNFA